VEIVEFGQNSEVADQNEVKELERQESVYEIRTRSSVSEQISEFEQLPPTERSAESQVSFGREESIPEVEESKLQPASLE